MSEDEERISEVDYRVQVLEKALEELTRALRGSGINVVQFNWFDYQW